MAQGWSWAASIAQKTSTAILTAADEVEGTDTCCIIDDCPLLHDKASELKRATTLVLDCCKAVNAQVHDVKSEVGPTTMLTYSGVEWDGTYRASDTGWPRASSPNG